MDLFGSQSGMETWIQYSKMLFASGVYFMIWSTVHIICELFCDVVHFQRTCRFGERFFRVPCVRFFVKDFEVEKTWYWSLCLRYFLWGWMKWRSRHRSWSIRVKSHKFASKVRRWPGSEWPTKSWSESAIFPFLSKEVTRVLKRKRFLRKYLFPFDAVCFRKRDKIQMDRWITRSIFDKRIINCPSWKYQVTLDSVVLLRARTVKRAKRKISILDTCWGDWGGWDCYQQELYAWQRSSMQRKHREWSRLMRKAIGSGCHQALIARTSHESFSGKHPPWKY